MKKDIELIARTENLKPDYENMHKWDFYAADITTEYVQSLEEGLDIEQYKDLFSAVSKLPKNEIRKKLGKLWKGVTCRASAPERASSSERMPSAPIRNGSIFTPFAV